jgi:hypothetical protein
MCHRNLILLITIVIDLVTDFQQGLLAAISVILNGPGQLPVLLQSPFSSDHLR